MKLKENKCIKEHEDYTDEALKKLCSEAGTCTLKAVDEKNCFVINPSQTLSCTVTCPLALPELGRDLAPLPLPTPRGPSSLRLSPPLLLHPYCLLGQFHPLLQLQFSQPAAPRASMFCIICWKAPWTSPTSVSISACVQSNLCTFPSHDPLLWVTLPPDWRFLLLWVVSTLKCLWWAPPPSSTLQLV